MPKGSLDFSSVRRILVVMLRHHGDVLLTSPLFTVLKDHSPLATLDALVYGETEDMLTLHPAINCAYTIDKGWKQRGWLEHAGQELRLLSTLRNNRYDLLIHLTENPRGLMLAWALGAPVRVGGEYRGKKGVLWRKSFTHLYRSAPAGRHKVEQHLDVLRGLGIQPRDDQRSLVLIPGPKAEAAVDDVAKQHGLKANGFIHLHPTSRWLFKCWDEAKAAKTIDALSGAGERIVITAAPEQKELAMVARIKAQANGPVIDLAGKLSLKELAALTARAKCFIGVDSVPMHIAAAMGTPVVALFGPSGEAEWGPWQVRHRIIKSRHPCRPCGIDGCGGSKVSECLISIPVQAVVDAVADMGAAGHTS